MELNIFYYFILRCFLQQIWIKSKRLLKLRMQRKKDKMVQEAFFSLSALFSAVWNTYYPVCKLAAHWLDRKVRTAKVFVCMVLAKQYLCGHDGTRTTFNWEVHTYMVIILSALAAVSAYNWRCRCYALLVPFETLACFAKQAVDVVRWLVVRTVSWIKIVSSSRVSLSARFLTNVCYMFFLCTRGKNSSY